MATLFPVSKSIETKAKIKQKINPLEMRMGIKDNWHAKGVTVI